MNELCDRLSHTIPTQTNLHMDLDSTNTALDAAKKLTPKRHEYWMARDLQVVLEYKEWDNFAAVIEKAIRACIESGEAQENHFRPTTKMVGIGSGAQRSIPDYYLDRYACYLIAMNGNPAIQKIAKAQTYFAVQVRRQEIQDEAAPLDKRIAQRQRLKTAVVKLNAAAKAAGVQNFAFFHDAGYRGLYEMGLTDIKRKKGLAHDEDLYDRAGRAELAANEFHKTQTEEKLAKTGLHGQQAAQNTYREVGQQVREAIRKIGGTMPEDMKPEVSIKELERQRKLEQKRLGKK